MSQLKSLKRSYDSFMSDQNAHATTFTPFNAEAHNSNSSSADSRVFDSTSAFPSHSNSVNLSSPFATATFGLLPTAQFSSPAFHDNHPTSANHDFSASAPAAASPSAGGAATGTTGMLSPFASLLNANHKRLRSSNDDNPLAHYQQSTHQQSVFGARTEQPSHDSDSSVPRIASPSAMEDGSHSPSAHMSDDHRPKRLRLPGSDNSASNTAFHSLQQSWPSSSAAAATSSSSTSSANMQHTGNSLTNIGSNLTPTQPSAATRAAAAACRRSLRGEDAAFPALPPASVTDILDVNMLQAWSNKNRRMADAAAMEQRQHNSHANAMQSSPTATLSSASHSDISPNTLLTFSYEQFCRVLQSALSKREEQLRTEYNTVLDDKLREQFENFSSFNRDYISRQLSKNDFSYCS